MIDLKEYIRESILDDIDDQIDTVDKYLDVERAKKWMQTSRNTPKIYVKKAGLVLGGEIIIDDIEGEEYDGTPIKNVKGNISISNCKNLKSLKGMFLPDTTVDGTLTIEDCPNFVSLEGAPKEVGTLVISGNKNFKNIDSSISLTIHNNLYLFKNGKRFDKEKLLKSTNIVVGKRIMCSAMNDDALINEANINEAVKSPLLHILANAIKKNRNRDKWGGDVELESFIDNIKFDTIKSSNVHEYDSKHSEVSKLVRAYCSGKISGFYFTLNKEGDVTTLFIGDKLIEINKKAKGDYLNRYQPNYHMQVNYIVDYVKNCDTVVFVEDDQFRNDSRGFIRGARMENRKGATAMRRGDERDMKNEFIDSKTVRYYQEIADENRERYKRMLNELKAKKHLQNNNFDKYKGQVDDLFDRYTTLLKKMMSNPNKYSSWELSTLNLYFKSSHSYGGKGLMDKLQAYFELIKDAGDSYYSTRMSFETEIAKLEPELDLAIKKVDEKLKYLEAK